MHATSITDIGRIESLSPYWEDLADQASEPNPFFEYWYLTSAIRNLLKHPGFTLLVIWTNPAENRISGLLPIVKNGATQRNPVPNVSVWVHPLCFLGTPLVRRGEEHEFWKSVFEWLDSTSNASLGLTLREISGAGPVGIALQHTLKEQNRNFDEIDLYQRGAVQSSLEFQAYLPSVLSGKHIKELRKKRRNLEALGSLRLIRTGAPEEIRKYTAPFLELEQQGWKGRQHSALAQDSPQKKFFEEITESGSRLNHLGFQGFELNGRLIAGYFYFILQDEIFGFKIAYDEEYGRFSPGTLLELELLEFALSSERKLRIDSCAAPGAESYRRLYAERKPIRTVLAAKNSAAAQLTVRCLAAARRFKRRLFRARTAN